MADPCEVNGKVAEVSPAGALPDLEKQSFGGGSASSASSDDRTFVRALVLSIQF